VADAVQRFESEFASAFGFAGAVATGFGRSAVALALRTWEVRGRKVLVPEFACAQVAQAVRGADGLPAPSPVETNLTVSPSKFADCLGPHTAAAIAVHYFGRALPAIEKIAAACRDRSVKLLEDCALALGVPGIGHAGDAAVFSLTKSDWCYGGGVLASDDENFVREARNCREKYFKNQKWRALRYGLLRRADFDANRPSLSRRAEFRGRWLDRVLGFGRDNFFDAGSFDARMSDAAARRGLQIVKSWKATCARRKEIVSRLRDALGETGALFHAAQDGEDSGEFLLLRSPAGCAHDWVEAAARKGVTLRLSWPAYQELQRLDPRSKVHQLAGELLILEIHPQMSDSEIRTIATCLQRLSAKRAAG
jgi:dTDP-4-amino-4,6-dideoxygalactose transaminase